MSWAHFDHCTPVPDSGTRTHTIPVITVDHKDTTLVTTLSDSCMPSQLRDVSVAGGELFQHYMLGPWVADHQILQAMYHGQILRLEYHEEAFYSPGTMLSESDMSTVRFSIPSQIGGSWSADVEVTAMRARTRMRIPRRVFIVQASEDARAALQPSTLLPLLLYVPDSLHVHWCVPFEQGGPVVALIRGPYSTMAFSSSLE